MAAVVNYRGAIRTWGNGREYVEVTYDFAKDGGATGALDLFEVDSRTCVLLAEMHVDTTCTSGGSATVEVGISGDTAGLIGQTAVGSLSANAVILGASRDASHNLAADAVVQMTIGTAALTAGKIRFVFELSKF